MVAVDPGKTDMSTTELHAHTMLSMIGSQRHGNSAAFALTYAQENDDR